MDKTPPFRCPKEGCNYQTKHKPDWARHYGSVHQLIPKYLKEYLEEQLTQKEAKNNAESLFNSSSMSNGGSQVKVPAISDGERTYSAFLPKADLNQVQ